MFTCLVNSILIILCCTCVLNVGMLGMTSLVALLPKCLVHAYMYMYMYNLYMLVFVTPYRYDDIISFPPSLPPLPSSLPPSLHYR